MDRDSACAYLCITTTNRIITAARCNETTGCTAGEGATNESLALTRRHAKILTVTLFTLFDYAVTTDGRRCAGGISSTRRVGTVGSIGTVVIDAVVTNLRRRNGSVILTHARLAGVRRGAGVYPVTLAEITIGAVTQLTFVVGIDGVLLALVHSVKDTAKAGRTLGLVLAGGTTTVAVIYVAVIAGLVDIHKAIATSGDLTGGIQGTGRITAVGGAVAVVVNTVAAMPGFLARLVGDGVTHRSQAILGAHYATRNVAGTDAFATRRAKTVVAFIYLAVAVVVFVVTDLIGR